MQDILTKYTKKIPNKYSKNNLIYPNISKIYKIEKTNTKYQGPARPWCFMFILYILYTFDIFGYFLLYVLYMFRIFVGIFCAAYIFVHFWGHAEKNHRETRLGGAGPAPGPSRGAHANEARGPKDRRKLENIKAQA